MRRSQSKLNEARAAEGSDFGVFEIDVEGQPLKVKSAKRVSWDQDELNTILMDMVERDVDPSEYIDTKLSVSENAYKAWPSDLRKLFENARITKTSESIEL